MKTTTPPPPKGLTASSRALWRTILAGGRCSCVGSQELLAMALAIRDRIGELRAIVHVEGLVTENLTTKTKHKNPAAQLLLEWEKQFSRLWKMLELDTASSSYTVCGADLDELLAGEDD